jgi:sugar O-acyltransferase (sialic acid O-acetyltransferase NeuD family)
MKKFFCILGQSNCAVAVILDTLSVIYPHDEITVDIVANIPEAENGSIAYPFVAPGIDSRVFYYTDWQPRSEYTGYFIGSIGKSRRAIAAFFQAEFNLSPALFPALIHPSAVCSPTMQAGPGLHISPLSVVAPHTLLGSFVVLNRQVSIGHHTVLGDFVTVSPGVTIAGGCQIEPGVTIGAGATVLDKVTIGKNSLIGAGSLVTRPIPEGVVAYGAPAKVIREIA